MEISARARRLNSTCSRGKDGQSRENPWTNGHSKSFMKTHNDGLFTFTWCFCRHFNPKRPQGQSSTRDLC